MSHDVTPGCGRRPDRRAIGWWTVQATVWTVPPALVPALLTVLIAPARRWLATPEMVSPFVS